MSEEDTIQSQVEQLKELVVYNSEEGETAEYYLEGKSFWDAQDNEWGLITWIEQALKQAEQRKDIEFKNLVISLRLTDKDKEGESVIEGTDIQLRYFDKGYERCIDHILQALKEDE